MINDKALAIAKLKSIINDTAASPQRRIQAAIELLARFGPSKRAVPLIKSIIRTFEDYQDATSKARTAAVHTAVEQLQENLKLALRTQAAQKDLVDEDGSVDETVPSREPASSAAESASEPEPVAPHELIANAEVVDPAVLASLDTASFFDWRGFDGRTDLNPVLGKDLKEIDCGYGMSQILCPHPQILEKLFELFELDLPAQDHHDPHYKARKIESCWFFLFGEKEFAAAEQRLKAAPWLEFVHQPGEPTRLRVTEFGERKRFLELLRARVAAGLDVYGRLIVDNGSL